MDQENRFVVRFEGVDPATATKAAADLRSYLRREVDGQFSADTLKEAPDTMDGGATLVLVLGAPAIVAVAHGIASWMANWGPKTGGEFVMKRPDGTVVFASGAAAVQAAKLAGKMKE